jgi:RNA polymerase sigma factor (sigma-70 family)
VVRLTPREQPRECSVSELKTLFLSMRSALAHAASKIVPVHEVEDIVQETYVKLCLVKNPEQIKHPKSYLYQMAKNLARDHAKSSGNRLSERFEEVEDFLHTREDLVYREVVSSQEFRAFCEAVRHLPLQCRRAFVLKKVYGYSQREIAKELKITESTVEKHVALGLRRCAEKMPSRALAKKLKIET